MNNSTPTPRASRGRRFVAGGALALSSVLVLGACGDDDEGTVDDGVEEEIDDVGNELGELGEDTGDAIEEETDDMNDDEGDADTDG